MARSCKFPHPELRLCLEFDDGMIDPIVHDGSPNATDAAAAALVAVTRPGSVNAVAVGPGTTIQVPEAVSLDLDRALTLEMWIDITNPAAASLIRNEGQYELAIDATGKLTCSLAGGGQVTAPDPLPASTWTHVGCSFERDRMRLLIGGAVVACSSVRGAVPTAGTTGTAIAATMQGAIDDVRIYAATLFPDDQCAHADATRCNTRCPDMRFPYPY